MDPYLSSFRDGQNIYYLSKEGRELVGCKKVRKKTHQARHYIMRNSLYIAYGSPSSWKNEMKIGVKSKVTVICDALFTQENRYHIVEVDHTQKMSKNRSKIDRYKKLLELNVFQVKPKFIWITTTEYRRKQLLNLCEGLDVEVFTISEFH
jgi:hypothetical protein